MARGKVSHLTFQVFNTEKSFKKSLKNQKKGKRGKAKWTDRNSELDMSNERFEKYYKAQQILPEDEWDAFMNAMRQPLPSTFRIAANRQMKDVLSDSIRDKFVPQLEAARLDGDPLPVPQPIPWYPDGLAWHVGLARKELKKSPDYKKFHEFLVYETEVGNISRQEAVSMLPPLFLDVRPHHNVIDLCAAPGSKTSQLLEAMDPPTGLLIANDADHKRAHLLVHQSSRLPSPGLMVTNLDASIFPQMKYQDKPLRFDRILVDVPCSGDGTLRKNVGIWTKWQPMEGNGLHSLQLRILKRAMRMLKHDSSPADRPRIVYSTCSLNPVENEAVVAAALNSVPGFELMNVSDALPTLIRRPGVTSWRPSVNRDVDMPFSSYKEYCNSMEASNANEAPINAEAFEEAEIPVGDGSTDSVVKSEGRAQSKKTQDRPRRHKMYESHWPPENVSDLHLDRCIRVYPHSQDTGGFFVAILQWRSPTMRSAPQKTDGKRPVELVDADSKLESPTDKPAMKKSKLTKESESADATLTADTTGDTEPTAVTGSAFKEDPYTFVSLDDPTLLSCIERMKLSDSFPRSNLYVRNAEGTPIRSLYLVNDAVRSVMTQTNFQRIRLISAGVKLFGRSELGNTKKQREREDAQVQFRVLHEGLLALLPYANEESIIAGGPKELRGLLQAYYPLCASFEEPFRTQVQECSIGSHIIRFTAGDYGNASLSHDLFLPLWKSDVSISLMIDKRAKSALSLRIFGEDVTVAGQQAERQREQKKTTKVEDETVGDEDQEMEDSRNEDVEL